MICGNNDESVKERLLAAENKSTSGLPPLKKDLTASPKFNRSQKQVLTLLSCGDFSCFFALSIMALLFPAEATRKGMSTTISGFVFGIYAFVLFFVSPFMGALTGRIQAKILLIQGLGLVGFSHILFGFSSSIDFISFTTFTILVRIMTALGAAAYTASSYMIISDVFPENIGTALAFLKIGVGLGMTIGPPISGAIFDYCGFGPPFFVLGSLILLMIPVSLILLPRNSEQSSNNIEKHSICSLWKLFKLQPAIMLISLVVVVLASTWSFLEPTLEPHLRKFNLPSVQVGLFFMLLSGSYSLCGPIIAYVAAKMTRTWILMVVGLILATIALLLLGPSALVGLENTVTINIFGIGLLGVSISLALLPTFEALLEFAIGAGCPDGLGTYGLVGGFWASMYSLGEVIGPVFGAFITDFLGFPACVAIFAAITLISAIATVVHFDIERRDKLKHISTNESKQQHENPAEPLDLEQRYQPE